MSGLKFAICEARVTPSNRRDVDAFARLAHLSTERKLKPAESKRFARLQTQLHRQGVLVVLTREVLKTSARELYASLPWWRKLQLRWAYHRRAFLAWFEGVRLRLR